MQTVAVAANRSVYVNLYVVRLCSVDLLDYNGQFLCIMCADFD